MVWQVWVKQQCLLKKATHFLPISKLKLSMHLPSKHSLTWVRLQVQNRAWSAQVAHVCSCGMKVLRRYTEHVFINSVDIYLQAAYWVIARSKEGATKEEIASSGNESNMQEKTGGSWSRQEHCPAASQSPWGSAQGGHPCSAVSGTIQTPLFPASAAQNFSPPPAQAEIGCNNYFKKKTTSQSPNISYCPRVKGCI